MATKRSKPGMSWGEVAEYDSCVEKIRRSALAIAKETKYYQGENMGLVQDGELYVSNIKGYVMTIQNSMKKINSMSRKYRD